MNRNGASTVGRFSTDFIVANNLDKELAAAGRLASAKVRQMTISGVVDPGAVKLVLPRAVVLKLGMRISGTVPVKYANGHIAERETVDGVSVELLGRHGVFNAIVEPKRRDALIGAIVLEDLDFLVDPKYQRIIPRDPRHPSFEL